MMKLSAHENSPHYNREMIGHNRIMLNGEEMKEVTFADEDEGYIIVYKRDATGELVVNGDFLVSERLDGRVEIIDTRK